MTIKLVCPSNGGSVSLDSPTATNSNADLTLTLPTSTGSANQYLKNSGTAGQLEFAAGPSAGLFTAYAHAWVQRGSGDHAGAATAGSWGIVPFYGSAHKIESGSISITLSVAADGTGANTITIGAGTYLIKWTVPFFDTETSQSRLYDTTGSGSVLKYGTSVKSDTTDPSTVLSHGFHRATFSNSSTALRLEYDVSTSKTLSGLGVSNDSDVNIHSTIEFYKEG